MTHFIAGVAVGVVLMWRGDEFVGEFRRSFEAKEKVGRCLKNAARAAIGLGPKKEKVV